MGLFDFLVGGRTDDAAAGNGPEARYVTPRRDGNGAYCATCGAGNGLRDGGDLACKCDPKLGRPRKWYE